MKIINGDFNNDGRTDIALTGGQGWTTIPLALSNGDGRFTVTNSPVGEFGGWASPAATKVVSGDFNADGRTDIALTSSPGFVSVPVAFSNGDGTFAVTNKLVPDFPTWAGPATGPLQRTQSVATVLAADANSVTVTWTDGWINEGGFAVQKRNKLGDWHEIHRVVTRNRIGHAIGGYSFVDTDKSMGGQCYRIAAFNATDVGYANVKCTVRPDPDRFPQSVPNDVAQWGGIAGTDDFSGSLGNFFREEGGPAYVVYDQGDFGVDLKFGADPAAWGVNTVDWPVSVETGPPIMKGQSIGLHLAGRGWLTYDDQNFGVDLGLSDSKSFEWIVIGNRSTPADETDAGSPIASGRYALWNTRKKAFLVSGDQTTGMNLVWYNPFAPPPPPPPPPPPGVKRITIFNCAGSPSSSLDIPRPLKFWTRDATAGAPFTLASTVNHGWTGSTCTATSSNAFVFTPPTTNHIYQVRAIDYTKAGCDDPDGVITGTCIKSDTSLKGDTNGVETNFTIS